jgi:DNA-directed RNA polymerase specialized sigma24 family protein
VASESAGDGVAAGDPSPEDVVVAAETAAAVRRAAGALNDRQRLLVNALFYESPVISYDEVSRRTGLPVGSIGPTRIRTLKRLHRTLVGMELAA